MTRLARLVLLVTLPLVSAAKAKEDDKGPSPDVPEAAQLKVYVGKFQLEVSEPIKAKGVVEGKWVHDGRFVQQSFTLKDEKGTLSFTGTNLFTFDTKRKLFRSWRFFSSGDAIEFTGIWDEAKQTMTRNAPDPNDTGTLRMVGVFDKSGSQVWTIFKDDSKGKVETEIRGTHTPIK